VGDPITRLKEEEEEQVVIVLAEVLVVLIPRKVESTR
jgi:hypothetical protein